MTPSQQSFLLATLSAVASGQLSVETASKSISEVIGDAPQSPQDALDWTQNHIKDHLKAILLNSPEINHEAHADAYMAYLRARRDISYEAMAELDRMADATSGTGWQSREWNPWAASLPLDKLPPVEEFEPSTETGCGEVLLKKFGSEE